MTHQTGRAFDEPCPSCGSPDVLECEIRVNVDQVQVGWECRDCGHARSWATSAEAHVGHAVERRIVAVMPLHAITTIYGERGLRERLATETARLADSAGRRKVKQALQLAGRLHSLDQRQREPYVNHLLRVALRIICHYDVHDADVIAAALLHDAVEDHATDLSADGRPGAFAMLAVGFSPHVADLVEALTSTTGDEDGRYREHVATSLEAHPWARVIKASDFTDNDAGMIHTTGPKAGELARKYAPLVPVLADLFARPDTPLSYRVKSHIIVHLRNAQARFAAINPTTATSVAPERK